MSDVKCAVCGEPWDTWELNHGDVKAWEYDLFKKGAGCPSCEGVAPKQEEVGEDDTLLDHLRSLLDHEDPHAFDLVNDPEAERPKWEEPEEPLVKHWTCKGCGVSAAISLDAGYDGSKLSKDEIWLIWFGGEKVHYSNGSGPYSYSKLFAPEAATVEPEHKLGDDPYCPGCADWCAECHKTILTGHAAPDDPYEPGYSFPHPDNAFLGSVCMDCYEELEAEDAESEKDSEEEEEEEET